MTEKTIPEHMRTLAERVHLLRRRQRWSQAELAKNAGMSPTTLSNIEQAKAPTITVEHLVALAHILGTSPDYLLGIERPRRRAQQDRESELLPTMPAMA
jgi:transcriptional regulator with XRE-family HTH domain